MATGRDEKKGVEVTMVLNNQKAERKHSFIKDVLSVTIMTNIPLGDHHD